MARHAQARVAGDCRGSCPSPVRVGSTSESAHESASPRRPLRAGPPAGVLTAIQADRIGLRPSAPARRAERSRAECLGRALATVRARARPAKRQRAASSGTRTRLGAESCPSRFAGCRQAGPCPAIPSVAPGHRRHPRPCVARHPGKGGGLHASAWRRLGGRSDLEAPRLTRILSTLEPPERLEPTVTRKRQPAGAQMISWRIVGAAAASWLPLTTALRNRGPSLAQWAHGCGGARANRARPVDSIHLLQN